MIKIDMGMPEYCVKCPCSSDEYWLCEVENRELCKTEWVSNRPDWCPLIECEQVERISTGVIGVKDNKFSNMHKDDVIIADTINGKRYLRVVYGSPLQEFNFGGCWCGWDLQNEEVIPIFQMQGMPLIVGNIDDKEIYDKWESSEVEK